MNDSQPPSRRLLLVSDAWEPQVNGVVHTWQHVIEELPALGWQVTVCHPGLFRTMAAPRYPEIRLALAPRRKFQQIVQECQPDAIHIATEGPLGITARRWCAKHKAAFTTSYHTQFPDYLKRYFKIPTSLTWRYMRWFHGRAQTTLAPTAGVVRELHEHGITSAHTWCRGVDLEQFHPHQSAVYSDLERPMFVYAGRVATEKNIEAFLDAELPGSKVVVGDGPAKADLEARYPAVHWAGYRFGNDLAAHYADADVFVFPSRTDTFGIVMLEANACGVPVAAYPVTGPIDVVCNGVNGYLDDDLASAARRCLELPSQACIDHARANSWNRCAQMVVDHLVPMHGQRA